MNITQKEIIAEAAEFNGWLVVWFKADCLTWDLGLWVLRPPWEVFLRDPRPYLREFRRKLQKTLNG